MNYLMAAKFVNPSTDFRNIVPGEAVWLKGHIGVYIGGGKVIECTPAFKNCVQVTACLNIGAISGMNGRRWNKHGKLPYIIYDTAETPQQGSQDGARTPEPSGGTSAGSGTAVPKMCVGAKVQYSGPLYRDSNGNGQGKTVNGTFTVKYYYPGRKCGVHVDGLGWVPESVCSVVG